VPGQRVVGGGRHRRPGAGAHRRRGGAAARPCRHRGGQRRDRLRRTAAARRPDVLRRGHRGEPAGQRPHGAGIPAADRADPRLPAAGLVPGGARADPGVERLLRQQVRGGGLRAQPAGRAPTPRRGRRCRLPQLDRHRHGARGRRPTGARVHARPTAVGLRAHLPPGAGGRRDRRRRPRPSGACVRPALAEGHNVGARRHAVGHRGSAGRPDAWRTPCARPGPRRRRPWAQAVWRTAARRDETGHDARRIRPGKVSCLLR